MASFPCFMLGTFTPSPSPSSSSSCYLQLAASLKKKAFFLPLKQKQKKGSWHSPPPPTTLHSIRALAPPPPSPQSLFGLGWGPKLPDVVQAGDPVLHEVASPVPLEDIPSPPIQKVIDDMIAVMRRAPGVGLAAPQIGVPWQIIVLEDTEQYIRLASKKETDAQQRYPFDLLVIVNPRLEKKGHQVTRFFEGCLSVDGFRGLVERHLEVEVTGFARDGSPLRIEATGWKARILQHEYDHLQGLLYVDSLIPRTFRCVANLRLPLPKGCPKPGAYAKHEC